MTQIKMTDIECVIVHSDLASYGHDEDGTEIQLPIFYVVIELPNGTRYAHFKSFEQDPCGAEDLKETITMADFIQLRYWREIDPCYGSDAYQALDAMGVFLAREKKEEEDKLFNHMTKHLG